MADAQGSQLSRGLAPWESPESALQGEVLSRQERTGVHCIILRAPEKRGHRSTPDPTLGESVYV